MPQDYHVLQFKRGTWKDNNDNFWCDMALTGISEPVRIAVKDPQQFHDDMELYGVIEDATSQAGKPYLKFTRKKKEDDKSVQAELIGQASPKNERLPESPEKQHSINKSVALNNAVLLYANAANKSNVLAKANEFLGWLESTDPKVEAPSISQSVEEAQAQREAERDNERLHNTFQEDEVYQPGDDPIDINDIPF